ncbi:hypothetical protein O1611_g1383 [Lasiodiplodia mahajangana]|uniref:Uncharacterized protein n=1 Tax=Lasiodiplodia mahajangana TaxID=1108764 RepID=A0ACC2JY66_9PEZI|nr:hypothetical protein O1611_g1383 [Lasiodiplodia mahajangana]
MPNLVIALAVEDSQDGKEQVDDVKVKANSGCNLLFHMVLAQDELSIDQDVPREDKGSETTINQLAGATVGEEGSHEAEDDQAPERAKQIRHPRREVILGLACEQSEEYEDTTGENYGVQHDLCLVERDDDRDGICFKQGKTGEEEKVCRVGLALPVRQAHEADGAEELSTESCMLAEESYKNISMFKIMHQAVHLDGGVGGDCLRRPRPMPDATGSKSLYTARYEVSNCPPSNARGVRYTARSEGMRLTFANELVADVDGSLGDGAAELEVVGNVVFAAARRAAEDSGGGR